MKSFLELSPCLSQGTNLPTHTELITQIGVTKQSESHVTNYTTHTDFTCIVLWNAPDLHPKYLTPRQDFRGSPRASESSDRKTDLRP